jgi:putative transcriptional regulator
MPITVKLNVVMAQRNVKSKELAAYIGMSEQNLSIFKTGKIKGVRFSTLEKMCEFLDCKPGDIIDYER